MITLIVTLVSLDPHSLLEVCQGEDAVIMCQTKLMMVVCFGWPYVGESNTKPGLVVLLKSTRQNNVVSLL